MGQRDRRRAAVYPYLLEQHLRQRCGGRTIEVINASVPGYSTFQELRYLERDGLALEPDAIVLQFCLNDVDERYLALAEYGGNNYFLGVDTRQAIRGLRGWLIRRSRAFEAGVRWLRHRALDWEEHRTRDLARDEWSPGLEEAWQQMLGELDAIPRLAAERDLPLLLLLVPFRFQIEESGLLRVRGWAHHPKHPVEEVVFVDQKLRRRSRILLGLHRHDLTKPPGRMTTNDRWEGFVEWRRRRGIWTAWVRLASDPAFYPLPRTYRAEWQLKEILAQRGVRR